MKCPRCGEHMQFYEMLDNHYAVYFCSKCILYFTKKPFTIKALLNKIFQVH